MTEHIDEVAPQNCLRVLNYQANNGNLLALNELERQVWVDRQTICSVGSCPVSALIDHKNEEQIELVGFSGECTE